LAVAIGSGLPGRPSDRPGVTGSSERGPAPLSGVFPSPHPAARRWRRSAPASGDPRHPWRGESLRATLGTYRPGGHRARRGAPEGPDPVLRPAHRGLRRYLWLRLRRYLEDRGLVPRAQPIDLHVAMSRRRDVVVETVVDVGASDGRWSAQMMRHFPK